MKKTLLSIVCCVVTGITLQAQQKNWDTYSKNIGGGIHDIRVNNNLYDSGPLQQAPFLVKVTLKYTGARNSQLPTKTEASKLVLIQDATKKQLSAKTECYLAGAASHNKICEVYYYVKDTTGIRNTLTAFYKKKNFSRYKLDVAYDNRWDGYFSVLYPNEEQRQMIYYKRVIARLLKAGDKLKKPHKVTHLAYFKNEESMREWIELLGRNNYTYVSSGKNPYARYQVSFYRVTPLTEKAILGSIKDLKGMLATNTGAYGGWETVVMK